MRTRLKREDGFTLIEVIIAVALLLGTAVALGAFVIQGLTLASQQQRAQVAVTVATERMDEVQRLTGSSAQLTTLTAGRTESAVTNPWTAASGVSGLAETYPAWDTAAVDGSRPAFPVERTTTRSGSNYDSTVLIGTCYQPATGGTCTLVPGSPSDPGETSPLVDGLSKLIRVVVIVDYAGSCGDSDTCRYTTTGLFDTKGDLEWRSE